MATNDFPSEFDKAFVDIINTKIMKKEAAYLNEKNYKNTLLVDSLVRLIKKDEIINELYSDPIEILHKCSLNEGGFITCENRKIIYKYIITLLYKQKTERADQLPKTEKKEPSQVSNNKNDEPEQEQIKEKEDKTRDIIIKDCDRSVLNSLIKANVIQEEKNDSVLNKNEETTITESDPSDNTISEKERKQYLNNLKFFVRQALGEKIDYEYYQGYQDLALYFMILFGEEGIDLLYKFNKIFLGEYLKENKKENEKKNEKKKNFDDYLTILNKCLSFIDNNVSQGILKITNTKPYYSLSWLITWFSHKNDSLFYQFRLMDYFITSSFTEIFFFSGEVIISEYNKFISNHKNNSTPSEEVEDADLMGELFIHFQELKISQIDADKLALKTEKDKKNQKITENIEMIEENVNTKPLFDIVIIPLFFLLISLFLMGFNS